MFKNYFKIAWRNLRKHSFYTILNVFGLSVALACTLVLFLFLQYHLRFNNYHQKTASIYRIVTDMRLDDGSVHYEKGAPLALLTTIRQKLPQVQQSAFLFSNYRDHLFTVKVPSQGNAAGKLFSERGNVGFADGHWFEIFNYQWLAGDPKTALAEPNTVVLTNSQARKYFGNTYPVGRVIRFDGQHDVKITGLLKDYSANSDTQIDLFVSLSSMHSFYPDMHRSIEMDWGWFGPSTTIFLQLPEALSPATVDLSIAALTREHLAGMAKYYDFHLQPLKEVHFDSRYGGVISKSLLTTLGIIGIIILIIACVNFINLATAQNIRRTKEISTRRILGSSAKGIFWQFMAETTCITFLAVVLSLGWVSLLLPALNSGLQTTLQLNPLHNVQMVIALLSLTVFIVLAAGLYPSFLLSRFKPVDALKNRTGSIKQPWLRRSLILFQNIVAQSLIICTLIITLQTYFLKTADLGFNKDAVLMVSLPKPDKQDLVYLRNQLLSRPDISDVSFCFRPPASETFKAGSIKFDQRDWEAYTAQGILGDAHYLSTFGLQLTAGRNLDESDTTREFLVNETMMKKLGLRNTEEALGHQLIAGSLNDHAGTIVGIVHDVHLRPLRDHIEPLLITTRQQDYEFAGVKTRGVNPSAAVAEIKQIWESVYPDRVFDFHFLDDQIAGFYKKEGLLNKLIGSFALLAIIICCVGLLGLISLLTVQRTKEIGIRKVLGASIVNITALISGEFTRLVALALVLASVIGWMIMNSWLQGFAYRISIPWWVFFVAGICNLALVIITICYHSIRAALMNPVKSLRTE